MPLYASFDAFMKSNFVEIISLLICLLVIGTDELLCNIPENKPSLSCFTLKQNGITIFTLILQSGLFDIYFALRDWSLFIKCNGLGK